MAVTPAGVRDGDPAALAALTERRGGAVLAYARALVGSSRAVEASGAAFARFRLAVSNSDDLFAIDPERLLLHTTRCAAAARVPRPTTAGLRVRRNRPCDLAPELLVARAEGTLTAADRSRLSHHLERCASCRSLEERFRAAERAYHEAAGGAPPQSASKEIIRAMLAAAPMARVPADAEPVPHVEPAPAPGPATESEPHAEPDPEPFAEPEPEPYAEPEPFVEPYAVDSYDTFVAARAPVESPTVIRRAVHGRANGTVSGPVSIPSPFADVQRPAPPEHPVLRVVAPVAVVMVAIIVALAFAGVFSSSSAAPSQGDAAAVPAPATPPAPVTTPLGAPKPARAKRSAHRTKPAKTTTAATSSAATATPATPTATPTPAAGRPPARATGPKRTTSTSLKTHTVHQPVVRPPSSSAPPAQTPGFQPGGGTPTG